jgi:hypothetical protein
MGSAQLADCPGENGHEMATYAKTREVIFPYLTHPGKRYGSVFTPSIFLTG